MRRPNPSITTPIVWASVAMVLAIALLVGWTLLIVQNLPVARNSWLLVSGIIGFVIIMFVLVIFSVFLVREILEVRRQNSFIDSVTHELKSPLASLKLCLETMGRPNLSPDQRATLHEMMVDDVDRLAGFIDDVLVASQLAHSSSGGRPLTRIRLHDMVDQCSAAIEMRHKVTDVVRNEVPEDLVLNTDQVALETVLKNLIDNAIKYSAKKDVLVLVRVCEDEEGYPVIEVEDQGIGIPREDLKRVFTRFYRVESEEVRSRRGTGLGLFVVKSLVRYLGGRLSAHSEGEGKGTTMRVRMPEGAIDPALGPEEASATAIEGSA